VLRLPLLLVNKHLQAHKVYTLGLRQLALLLFLLLLSVVALLVVNSQLLSVAVVAVLDIKTIIQ
jgi:hypothetical protein